MEELIKGRLIAAGNKGESLQKLEQTGQDAGGGSLQLLEYLPPIPKNTFSLVHGSESAEAIWPHTDHHR